MLKLLLGDPNTRKLKRYQPIVEEINFLEEEISKLTDDELRKETQNLKSNISAELDFKKQKELLEEFLPRAFAIVREASKRVLDMRHFDVQLIGGMVLNECQIAEMKTGEGKTLVATLPCFLNALTGKGVHVVTVNDYLARRDAEWMGQVHRFLGLSVGLIQQDMNPVEKANKKNIFNGKIMEIEGLPNLKLEQAFELTDATAERSCAGSTILLSQETVQEYLKSNICLLEKMIESNYEDSKSISRRINDMKNWLKKPSLIQPDSNAQYEEIIEIDLAKVTQPIVACPNDPDNVKEITDVANTNIDEVFIGSCMTNIGHYRAAAKVLEGVQNLKAKLWICPPTKMDEETLKAEGYYKIFEDCGARLELPGCSLCMGNQARVDEGSVVFSTSTRNFDNRLGKNAQVFLGSAELAAVCALLGKMPEVEEYQDITKNKINPYSDELYRYLQFDEINDFSLIK